MQTARNRLFGNRRRYVAIALFLFSWVSVRARVPEPTLVGTWEGTIHSPAFPAANEARVQCVFLPQGDYTCMVFKPGIGAARQWGRYRTMAGEIDLEIEGHEPESLTMPSTDHAEIVSLTLKSLITRSWVMGSYVYTYYHRVQ